MTTQPIVFIDGDQGTTGLQIHQRLHGRTDLQVLTLPESDRKNPTRRSEAINSCDIAILCLPDGSLTPFELHLAATSGEQLTVFGTAAGQVSLLSGPR